MYRIVIIFLHFSSILFSEVDTIRIATYNILNYSISNSSQKNDDFRMILGEINPDILIVQEMLSSSGATYFMNSVLNHESNDYSSSSFIDGYDTDNMLYYKSDKVYMLGSDQISTNLRDISEYTLQVHDIIFNIYSLHLKASQGYSAQRLAEIQELHSELDTNYPYIVGGDFNIYNSSESESPLLYSSTYLPASLEFWGSVSSDIKTSANRVVCKISMIVIVRRVYNIIILLQFNN